ncbi:Cell cycle serine/threonine-protein kinase cdc5/MSD2 [Dinochytrium kinnereticum]|nr:Cell cycle serine/threonine-protein kinase cdc5/MSD2 [Dinochytrium kinnereticum]
MTIHDKKSGRQYTCGELLGEGGFARCYGVSDASGQKFAAKIIQKTCLASQKQKHKLFAEIKIHQMMSHPSIVKFYNVFEDESNVYMLLELCENKTLVEMLKARRRLTEAEVRFFMWHLLDAVRYMHKSRVIHRDLKLGNLFLSVDFKLKVGDFGLAAILRHDGERKNTICGTPNYIAPEVLFDSKKGHSYEVDLWSLGVIMYTLLIGKPPFQTKDVKAIYKNIRNNFYEFPAGVEISKESRNVIRSLLDSCPENRPSVEDVMGSSFFSAHPMPEHLRDSVAYCSAASTLTSLDRATVEEHKVEKELTHHKTGDPYLKKAVHITDPLQKSPSMKKEQTQQFPNAPTQKVETPHGNPPYLDPVSSARQSVAPSTEKLQENDYAPSKSLRNFHSLRADFPFAAKRIQSSLEVIYSNICKAFDSADSDEVNMIKNEAALPIFITKWIDYSNKYGLGYQLRDGTIGVYFNDSTSILMPADNKHVKLNVMEYLSYENASNMTRMRRRTFTLTSAPPELQKKVILLKHFGGYMQENLFKAADAVEPEIVTSKENIYLTKYMKTRHGVVFRLSNRLNFFDHTKLIIHSDGRVVSYIDKHRKLVSMESRLAARGEGLEGHSKEVMSRLQYAREIIHQMILKKQKKCKED